MSNPRILRLAVLGDGGVGKSAITINFTMRYFEEEYDPTIEDYYSRQIKLDDLHLMVSIFDTAGQEEYFPTRDHYIRNMEGFLVIYSITDILSFNQVQMFVDRALRVLDLDYVPLVIVGNKCDLETQRKVETQTGEKLAEKNRVAFCETSAKFGINVDAAVEILIKEVLLFWPPPIERASKNTMVKRCVVC